MASTLNLPYMSNTNTLTFSDSFLPRSHSFGQVLLPEKTKTLTSSRQCYTTSLSNLAASTVLISSPTKTTTPSTSYSGTHNDLANLWREIQGCNNWENLLEPLHPLLRREIIRYGEFVTACYKAFDLDPNSKRYLNCKYGKNNMLREIGMGGSGYDVTKYIYATPDINIPIQNATSSSCGRWIGFVSVASDEAVKRLGRRDILITFRGTVTNPEWIANFMSSLTPARLDPHNPRPDVKVESGFLTLYTSDELSSSKFGLGSCREQLLSEVSRLVNKYKGENISITMAGHSMGSALALLLAYDIAELGLNKKISRGGKRSISQVPVTVFSFGGPRVGNSEFKKRCEELGVKVLRIANVNDPITKLPGVVFNENFRVLMGGRYEMPWSCSCYAHVGVELMLDFFNMQNPSCVHDLESYISLLKCPKPKELQNENGDGMNNFAEKARDLLLTAQHINILPWIFAATTVMNLVQYSQTT
ncbi:Phospholipase A1-Ialpha2, chloroplastic [Quillaja saponaria]|uniref:Phospholipase A1-Ialpha2, chloroplastic n=1 Tax=Quillaja saponaria TaxID=32244 RepID=A0AAD7LH89_QUISA|nr:Phospholipase A1-Ialpha2, chloroplastic [Quillaja saponaria]